MSLKRFTGSLPVMLLIANRKLETAKQEGIRIVMSAIKRDGRWQGHIHATKYDKPCMCEQCRPKKELND